MPQVRLIGADGEQLGIVEIADALKRAQDADLDLVEVAPGSKPPVTRLLDYSKYKYEQEQKQKQARKHQQQVNIREIKLRPKIASHDYETKKGHVERFLKHHDKVKVTIMFRGREQAHPERGRALLQTPLRGPRRARRDRVGAAAGRPQHEHAAGARAKRSTKRRRRGRRGEAGRADAADAGRGRAPAEAAAETPRLRPTPPAEPATTPPLPARR